MNGRCTRDVWICTGSIQGDVHDMYGRCMGGCTRDVREMYLRYMGDVRTHIIHCTIYNVHNSELSAVLCHLRVM